MWIRWAGQKQLRLMGRTIKLMAVNTCIPAPPSASCRRLLRRGYDSIDINSPHNNSHPGMSIYQWQIDRRWGTELNDGGGVDELSQQTTTSGAVSEGC